MNLVERRPRLDPVIAAALRARGLKRCPACETVKERAAFSNGDGKDGASPYCKPCSVLRVSVYQKTPAGRRGNLARRRRYNASEHGRAVNGAWSSWNSKTNRAKCRARLQAWRAIQSGELVRQPCEKCGAAKVEAHHDDYSKPLAVRWLCRLHHIAERCNHA